MFKKKTEEERQKEHYKERVEPLMKKIEEDEKLMEALCKKVDEYRKNKQRKKEAEFFSYIAECTLEGSICVYTTELTVENVIIKLVPDVEIFEKIKELIHDF